MFKTKALVIGIISQVVIFALLFVLITLVSLQIGEISSREYLLAYELCFALSVGLSAFISAKIAWSKAFVYGIFMAVFAVLLRLTLALIFSAEISFSSLIIKFLILLGISICSSILGVTSKRTKGNNYV